MSKFALLSLALFALVATTSVSGDGESLPNVVDWMTFAEFKEFDLLSNTKPICFLVHKSWCGACKNLKKSLNSDKATQELIKEVAENFLMVSVTVSST